LSWPSACYMHSHLERRDGGGAEGELGQ